ncbi:GNAT family N-acetyltransferase [Myroides fluvii]|uniref:GNAT family N-acetyltransferase n=1 Tax=Myroides fluvii TaxID=2572594 RepID=UPI00131D69FB|nr:GNAT family N-acetyltransferase [Myroides fluvii]
MTIKPNFHSQCVLLKNKKQVVIREAQPEDALALIQLIQTYLEDSEYIPLEPAEFTKTEEEGVHWITSLQTASNSLFLLAEYEGRIIGNLDLTGHGRKALQHTAILGMGMLKEWRGCGLGTALVCQAMDWAKQQRQLELIWLQVYEENKAAIALYQKHGFTTIGIMPAFIKANHRYYNNQIMQVQL